ncbi:unnamed protein product [Tenebrio molitor]|nr:unnamed protein product [Tenebrio molitor]
MYLKKKILIYRNNIHFYYLILKNNPLKIRNRRARDVKSILIKEPLTSLVHLPTNSSHTIVTLSEMKVIFRKNDT